MEWNVVFDFLILNLSLLLQLEHGEYVLLWTKASMKGLGFPLSLRRERERLENGALKRITHT